MTNGRRLATMLYHGPSPSWVTEETQHALTTSTSSKQKNKHSVNIALSQNQTAIRLGVG